LEQKVASFKKINTSKPAGLQSLVVGASVHNKRLAAYCGRIANSVGCELFAAEKSAACKPIDDLRKLRVILPRLFVAARLQQQ
jgi:hypothetical protein